MISDEGNPRQDALTFSVPHFVLVVPSDLSSAELAAARRLPVRTVSSDAIREAFPHANRNKHEIAKAAADRYPTLLPYLPAKRKPWRSEHYRMSVFAAAALVLTYFAQPHHRKQE